MTWVLLAVLVNVLSLTAYGTVNISTPGDIILGGLFPVHKKGDKENVCGEFNEIPGYQYMEAMLYALEKINERQDILPGIKLGTIIYDTCRSPTITADRTKDFIKLTLTQSDMNGSEFAGVIGPFTSGNSKIVGSFLRVFEIPQISYASLSVELSDKDIFNYFFRTVPPDSFFAEALAEFLQILNWSYVSIIYSTGTYSETGTMEVTKALEKRGICVAKKHQLPSFPKDNDFDKAIEETARVEEANIVVFVTIQRDSRGLLKAKGRQSLAKRLSFVGSIAWSNRDDITKGLGDVADGTVTFGHQEGNNTGFDDHFRSLNLSNYNSSYKGWFETFWQKQFNCSLGSANYSRNCTGRESLLTQHMEIAPVRVVINAVNAMAYALHNMHQSLCPNVSGLCQRMKPLSRTLLQKFLKNVTFPDSAFLWPIRFDQNNEVVGNYTVLNFRKLNNSAYSYVPVGKWYGTIDENGTISGQFHIRSSDILWSNGNRTVPSSVCSLPCDKRSVSIPRAGSASKCCWDCKKCEEDDVILNNTCSPCVKGYIPDKNSSRCTKLPLKYVNMNTPLSVFLVLLAMLGVLADLAVFVVFFIHRRHRLIKASSREMCYIMFLGIFAIFLVTLTTLAKPSEALCYFRRFLIGISFTICYAPLLMKIWRIHRIFKNANQMRRTTGLIGRRSQLLITVGLIAIQGLFCVVIFSTDSPHVKEKFYPDDHELVLECALKPSVFVAYLAYNVVLMLLCTIYAFLTRNFPKNFNEAMHIGITMYLTCAVWVVFLACFLNVGNSLVRVHWISGASVVIGWITLIGLFAPRVYQLYTKKEFDESTLMTWGSMVFKRSESSENGVDSTKDTGLVTLNPMTIDKDEHKRKTVDFQDVSPKNSVHNS